MTAQGIFVTGTDTGVGKTVVSALLLALCRAQGMDAVPMKPVQTGAIRRHGRWRAPDLDFCLAVAGLQPQEREYALMAPCCFAKACSPHLASAMARRPIRIKPILNSFRALRRSHRFVIVEGSGGVLVPLNERETMLDLISALTLPVLVVSRFGLGTINHTLLALKELRRARANILGVVFNATRPDRPDYIERDNIRTVARLGAVRVLGRLPFIPDMKTCSFERFRLAATAGLPPAADWLAWMKAP